MDVNRLLLVLSGISYAVGCVIVATELCRDLGRPKDGAGWSIRMTVVLLWPLAGFAGLFLPKRL